MSATLLIGVDYSTQAGKVGLAFGRPKDGGLDIEFTECPETHATVKERIVDRIKQESKKKPGAVLLAIDAPLGWPKSLIESLCNHKSGGALSAPADRMFMRETDRWVRKEIGKAPLKVGADKIALQAHHALRFLNELRNETECEIPLAWKPGKVDGVSVIEVYPAATLKGRGLRCIGYKGDSGKSRRREILKDLRNGGEVTVCRRGDVTAMHGNDHVFDAMLCALAAADFAENKNDAVTPPEKAKIDGATVGVRSAKKEGWIWVRKV